MLPVCFPIDGLGTSRFNWGSWHKGGVERWVTYRSLLLLLRYRSPQRWYVSWTVSDDCLDDSLKTQNWRLSCKSRHLVDGSYTFSSVVIYLTCFRLIAVHHHFAQIFSQYKISAGDTRPDSWTFEVFVQSNLWVHQLLVMRAIRVGINFNRYFSPVVYPSIADAIDDDGSGYVSVQEAKVLQKEACGVEHSSVASLVSF